MENKWLEIGKPYLIENNNSTKLCADIYYNNTEKTMYFEVESKWGHFLCSEYIDAFVVGLLYFAVCNGYSIKSNVPMNKQLYFQLKTYVIPVLNQIDASEYQPIEINVPLETVYYKDAHAVGASVSGGVDSFYTLVKHSRDSINDYRISHVLISNLFNKYDSEDIIKERFHNLVKQADSIAQTMNLEMIPIYTNHHDFMYNHFVSLYSFRLCSYAYALQKLFRVYYISSGAAVKDTNFFNVDSDDYDVFNLGMATTDTLKFYSSGGEALRTEKLKFIADDSTANRYLHVCNFSDSYNCSKCDKCLRTMVSLDIVGKLNNFNHCFDLKMYKKNKNKVLKRMYSEDWHLYQDIIDSAKKYNYSIPISCKLQGYLIYKPFHKFKNIIKKCDLIKKIYFKLKIDYLIYGREKAEIYRYGRNDIRK